MTDADALLSAVLAAPDDDLPRLVYADFLEEAGDPDRAEFIRVQCDIARGPADADPGLASREAELLAANRAHWQVPGLRRQLFRRGFVESVHDTADRLIDARDHLALVPLRGMRVANADARAAELAALPVLGRLEWLNLRGNTFTPLVRFLGAADLRRLRSLGLANCRVWADGLRDLAAFPVAAGLARLDLSGNPFGDDGAEVLATAPAFAGLRELHAASDHLDFDRCVHGAGANHLAGSRTLTRLRVLDLERHHVGDAGLIDLVTSPNAASLEDLNVGYNDIGSLGERAFEAVAGSPHLGRLRRLRLAGSQVSPLAALALSRWPRLGDGLTVDLRGSDLSGGVRETLLRSPWRERLVLDEE